MRLDASAERLQAFADAVRRLGPYFQEAMDRLERLKEQGVGETAPRPGETMPRFVLPDETGQASGQGPSSDHLSSRTLVPLLPHQHPRAG